MFAALAECTKYWAASYVARRVLGTWPVIQYCGPSRQIRHSSKTVIFSGIQPTGVPHLGNYLGALQQWVKLQNEAAPTTQLMFSIVDLHALTSRQDPEQLRRWKRETLAALLAVGLDPERSTIFFQSDVWLHYRLGPNHCDDEY